MSNKDELLELLGHVSINAFRLSIKSYCEVKTLKKELISFMAAHSSESEDDITKRLENSFEEIFKEVVGHLPKELQDLSEASSHEAMSENKKH